jgi:pyrophosphatase PpaX
MISSSDPFTKEFLRSMALQQPIKAILLDLDGTLVNSLQIHTEAWDRMLKDHLGVTLEPGWLNKYIGTPTQVTLGDFASHEQIPVLLDAIVQNEFLLRDRLELFPEIRPALQKLHSSGIKLAVVTSQTDAECDLEREALDLDPFIDLWVTSSMVSSPKPDPAPVLKAMELFNLSAAEVVMIGDTFNDLESGRQAGTRIGAVMWGFGQREKLLSYHPDYIFEHPGELLNLAHPVEM